MKISKFPFEVALLHVMRVKITTLLFVLSVIASHSVLQKLCININTVNLIFHTFKHETSQALVPLKAYSNGKGRN